MKYSGIDLHSNTSAVLATEGIRFSIDVFKYACVSTWLIR